MKKEHVNADKKTKRGHIILLLLFLCSALLGSCEKEREYPEIVIPTRVSFEENSYIIDKDDTQGLIISLKLARPLEKDGTIILQLLDENTTATASEFTVSPVLTDGQLAIELSKGTSTASFTVKSLHNFDGNKTVAFKLAKGTGGAVLDERDLETEITLRGNDWVEPLIQASVDDLGDFGNIDVGTTSAAKSFTLSGFNLDGPVTIQASANFQVSLDDNSYSEATNADINDETIDVYVKFTPNSTTNQTIIGSITISLSGMPDVVVSVAGTEQGNVPDVPLLVENFDYGASTDFLLRITTNWAAYSAEGSIPVTYIPEGLSFTNYVGSGIGGAATMMNGSFSREDINRLFTAPQTSGTVYTSLLVNFSAAGTGEFFFANRDGAGGFFNRFYAKDGGDGNLVLGVGKNTAAVYATTNYKYNTTYLVVIKHDFSTQISSMYVIDGAIPDTEPTAAAAQSAATGTSPTSLNDVVIRQAETALSATIDGIRVATTWKGVLGK